MRLIKPFIDEKEFKAVKRVFESAWLGSGPEVSKFEEELTKVLGNVEVIATNSGTAALELTLNALDLPLGSEVIVPSFTFIAAIQAMLNTGLVPVFADISPHDLNINLDSIASSITNKTKLIMPVHFKGFPCAMEEIAALAKSQNLLIVEDAAHAFGSKYMGTNSMVGTCFDISCFSFDPIKSITCGEGGAVVVPKSDKWKEFTKTIRIMNGLGIERDTWKRNTMDVKPWDYDVKLSGYRTSMSSINAAIGREQLKKFDLMNQKRIDICKKYDAAFRELKQLSVFNVPYSHVAPFMYMLRVEDREGLIKHLFEFKIPVSVHYKPCHLHPKFSVFQRTSLKYTEEVYEDIITLPLHPGLNDNDIHLVIDTIERYYT